MRNRWIFAAAAAVCVLPLLAWSLGAASELPSFWVGALRFFTAPLAIVTVVNWAAALSMPGSATEAVLASWAGASAFLTALLFAGAPSALAPLAIAMTGFVSIANYSAPGPLPIVLTVLAGMAAGLSATGDPLDGFAALGVGATVLTVCFWLKLGLARAKELPLFRTIFPVARRVIGAWSVTIALLLLGLAHRMQ